MVLPLYPITESHNKDYSSNLLLGM